MITHNIQTPNFQTSTFTYFGAFCEQHVDEVASYWGQWQIAMNQPLYDKSSLKVLEDKIRFNIAGMMSNADAAWTYASCTLPNANAGDIFAATQIAFRTYKTRRIREVVSIAVNDPNLSRGMISALAWLPQDIAHPWLSRFLKSADLNHKALALKTCRLRGEMPHKYLKQFLQKKNYISHAQLYFESLRIVGELKISSEKDCLLKSLTGSESMRFWGLYSLVLLGEHHFAKQLAPYIFEENEFQFKAIDLAFRVLPVNEAWDWISELKESSRYKRRAVQATGCLGDPAGIPWLLEQMRDPTLSRLCGEAFFNITGINLNATGLSIEAPYSHDELLTLDSTHILSEFAYDEHLPWPDVEKIWVHWHTSDKTILKSGTRYLLGKTIGQANLKSIIENSKQRQRKAATLELTLIDDDYCLFSSRGICSLER